MCYKMSLLKYRAFADGLESVIIEAVASHLLTRFFTFQFAGIAIPVKPRLTNNLPGRGYSSFEY